MAAYRQRQYVGVFLIVAVALYVQGLFAYLYVTEERATQYWFPMVLVPSTILAFMSVYFASNYNLLREATRLVDEHGSGTHDELKIWMAAKLMGIDPAIRSKEN